jgi:hypothetical protein
MKNNLEVYIEAAIILTYNGESCESYTITKELNIKIIIDDYKENNR